MKKQTILIIALLLSSIYTVVAQCITSVGPGQNCSIKFDYDDAGNRIKRYQHCTGGPGGNINRLMDTTATAATDTPAIDNDNSIANNEELIAQLYPNPTRNTCTISFNKDFENATLMLFDMQGKVLQQQTFSGSSYTLQLGAYPVGQYQVAVLFSGGNVRKMVVRQ